MSYQVPAIVLAAGAACSCNGQSPPELLDGNPSTSLEAVLATGDALPVVGNVRQVLGYDVNDRCNLAVSVDAWAPGTDNPRNVILAGPHARALTPRVIGGQPLPGNPGYVVATREFAQIQIGAGADLSFLAPLVAGGRSGLALVRQYDAPDQAVVLGRLGDPVGGALPAGAYYTALGAHGHSGGGVIGQVATIAGPGINSATDQVLILSGPIDRLLVQEGVPAPWLNQGIITFTQASTPTVSREFAAWTGLFRLPGQDNRPAVLATARSSPSALGGDPAPGLPGVVFQEFHPFPAVGEGGAIAYTAALAGAGVTASNRMSIWMSPGELIARGDQRAPGTPEGVRFASFSAPVLYGPDNYVLFTATLQGVAGDQGRTALFAGPRGEIGLIARDGDRAPGTPDGVVFGVFSPLTDADPIFVNEAGTIVFLARLRGPGVTGDNDLALFAWDPGEGLTLVAREGQTAPVRGELRTIATLSVSGQPGPSAQQTNGRDGRRTILNRHGECFFTATFAGPSQALMKAQVTHPPCIADFNLDRFIDCFDYIDFVAAFERGDPAADVNEDDFIDFFDYGAFVEWFEAGC